MGPNGQLFGSISLKEVKDSLFAQINNLEKEFKQLKNVELLEVYDYDPVSHSKGVKLSDIRKKGVYLVTLRLHHSLPPTEVYLNIISDN